MSGLNHNNASIESVCKSMATSAVIQFVFSYPKFKKGFFNKSTLEAYKIDGALEYGLNKIGTTAGVRIATRIWSAIKMPVINAMSDTVDSIAKALCN